MLEECWVVSSPKPWLPTSPASCQRSDLLSFVDVIRRLSGSIASFNWVWMKTNVSIRQLSNQSEFCHLIFDQAWETIQAFHLDLWSPPSVLIGRLKSLLLSVLCQNVPISVDLLGCSCVHLLIRFLLYLLVQSYAEIHFRRVPDFISRSRNPQPHEALLKHSWWWCSFWENTSFPWCCSWWSSSSRLECVETILSPSKWSCYLALSLS